MVICPTNINLIVKMTDAIYNVHQLSKAGSLNQPTINALIIDIMT